MDAKRLPMNGHLPNLAAFKLRGLMKSALEAAFKDGVPSHTVIRIEMRFPPNVTDCAAEARECLPRAWWQVVEKGTLRGFDVRREGQLTLKDGPAHEDGGVSFYLEWSSAAPTQELPRPTLAT